MLKKTPVPMALLKQSLGLREDIEIIKATISNDVVYLYTVTEGDSAAELTPTSSGARMEFSVTLSETS